MPSASWKRNHYKGLQNEVIDVLVNPVLSNDIKTLSRLVKKFPKTYVLYSSIYNIHKKAGRNVLANSIWVKMRKIFGHKPNLYFMRARWAIKEGSFKQAASDLRLCLMADNGYFGETACFWRAECLYRTNSYFDAQKELEKVSDDYQEMYFFGYKKRSKIDLINDINSKIGKDI